MANFNESLITEDILEGLKSRPAIVNEDDETYEDYIDSFTDPF